MADIKISALTATTLPLSGAEEIPINDSGVTEKITVAQLFTNPVVASYTDTTAITDPVAPSAGTLRTYVKNVAGRMIPKWKGPSGIDTQFQAALDGNSVTMWLPGTGTTAAINFGVSWTVGATQAHPAIAATNLMTSIKRATYTTTTTAGNASGILSAAAVAVYTTTAGVGGFFYAARFGVLTFQGAMQIFVGLTTQATILAGQPSALPNAIGVGKDSADTTWQMITTNSTPTATKTNTAVTVAAGGASGVYDVFFFAAPGGSAITCRLVDIGSNTIIEDNVALTGNLPANNSLLVAHADVRNSAGGAGTACAIFLSKIYIECDN